VEQSAEGRAEQARRADDMGLGTDAWHAYSLGLGHLYYRLWGVFTDTEKITARARMRANAYESRGAGPTTAGEQRSLAADWICGNKMHSTHSLFHSPAFFSIELNHAVCGAALDIQRRKIRMAWQHRCKAGPPASSGSHPWPKKFPTCVFHVCNTCLDAERSDCICGSCKLERM